MRFIDFEQSHVTPSPQKVLHQVMKKVERNEGRPKLTLHTLQQLRLYKDQYTVLEKERLQQIEAQYSYVPQFRGTLDDGKLIDESNNL